MTYSEIKEAIKNRLEYVPASSQKLYEDLVMGGYGTGADFEEIMCEYVDAKAQLDRVKNKNKRMCLVYDAMGHSDYDIAYILGLNQSSVWRAIKWLKIYFAE